MKLVGSTSLKIVLGGWKSGRTVSSGWRPASGFVLLFSGVYASLLLYYKGRSVISFPSFGESRGSSGFSTYTAFVSVPVVTVSSFVISSVFIASGDSWFRFWGCGDVRRVILVKCCWLLLGLGLF